MPGQWSRLITTQFYPFSLSPPQLGQLNQKWVCFIRGGGKLDQKALEVNVDSLTPLHTYPITTWKETGIVCMGTPYSKPSTQHWVSSNLHYVQKEKGDRGCRKVDWISSSRIRCTPWLLDPAPPAVTLPLLTACFPSSFAPPCPVSPSAHLLTSSPSYLDWQAAGAGTGRKALCKALL